MFDVKKETQNICNFIKDYFEKNNLYGAIIGLSGGKDSTICAALLKEALGKEHVIGVTLPCHSKEEDAKDAKRVADFLGIELINFDLTATFDEFKKGMAAFVDDEKECLNSDINLKPRLRTASLYYLSALYSAKRKKTYIVCGTSNKSEIFVGYYTKGGDSVSDIRPIADLLKEEVTSVGEYLGLPHDLVYKTPSDGLSALSDEDKLGVTYKEIAEYMKDPSSLDPQTAQKIKKLHEASKHKLYIPTYLKGDQ